MPRMLDAAIKEQDEGDQAVSNMTESSDLSRSWQSRTLKAFFIWLRKVALRNSADIKTIIMIIDRSHRKL